MRNDLTVEDLMSTALITATVEETMDAADVDMKMAGIKHLLVVDGRNHLVGIVSDRDVLRAFGAMGHGKLIVGAIMSTNIQMIRFDALASAALEMMLEKKIHCLPVEGDDGQLVGVVTETDFMRLLLEEMGGMVAA